jgi:hypothetical protein
MGNTTSKTETAKEIGIIADGVKILTEMSLNISEQLKLSLEEYKKAELEMHERISNYGTLLDQQQKKEDPRTLVTPVAIAHARLMMTAAIYAFECAGKTHDRLLERQDEIDEDLTRALRQLAKMQVDYPAAYALRQMTLRQQETAYSLNG